MHDLRITKYILVVIIIISVIVFLNIIGKIYDVTLDDAKISHQKQQLEMVKIVSEGLVFFVDHLVKDFSMIDNLNSHRLDQSENIKRAWEYYHNYYDSTIVLSLIQLNKANHKLIIRGDVYTNRIIEKFHETIKDITDNNSRGNFALSDVFFLNHKSQNYKCIIVAIKVQSQSTSEEGAYIGCLVDFEKLIKNFTKPLKLSSNDFIWMLDKNGRLIFHPRHQEMIFKSVMSSEQKCMKCHLSFHVQRNIVRSKNQNTGEYLVQGDEPSKIFASVPIELGNQQWTVVISTFLPDVTNRLKNKFLLFFILGIIILITFLIFIVLIYFLNLKRIKANEEKMNLEKQQEYQEQLNHYSRLASIGELVDSVAHEINTPIGIINTYSEIISMKEANNSLIAQELEIIKRQTKRINDYTKGLLNFSKRISFEPTSIDIKSLLNESIFLIHPKLKEKKIKIRKYLSADNLILSGDQRQLEQVFINLINNAIYAVSTNGIIKISSKKVKAINGIYNENQIEYALVEIEDNGTGIRQNDIKNIFDPFFSTKAKSGTGLGLAISKSIVQRHKGKIDVESNVGKGTIFKVYLPLNYNKV